MTTMDRAEEVREELFDFNCFLQWVSPEVLTGSWELVENQTDLQILCKACDRDDALLIQARYELPLSLEDASIFCRPEVQFNSCRPMYDVEALECGVDEAIAPGDALARFHIDSSALKVASIAVMGKAPLQLPPGLPSDSRRGNVTAFQVRLILRRNLPREGDLVALSIPVCPCSGNLLEEYGPNQVKVFKLEAKPDDLAHTLVTEVRRIGRVPTWALATLVGHFSTKYAWLPGFRASPHWQFAVDDPSGFLIVSVRKFSRGPPLWPKKSEMLADARNEEQHRSDLSTEPAHWEAATPDFELSSYLMEFLARLGISVALHQSWEGLRLIHYQAAVQRRLWHEVWPRRQGAWKAMRAAYRRLHGGRNAPETAVGIAARFVPNVVVPLAMGHRAGTEHVLVARTFLHFSDVPGPARPRVGSDPADNFCSRS